MSSQLEQDTQTGNSVLKVDESITLEALRKGEYKLDDLTTEFQLLKNKISTMRYEMISLMRMLATVNEEDIHKRSSAEFFNTVQAKVITLKEDIDSYVDRYRKIQPLVEFSKREADKPEKPPLNVLLHEVKIDPPIFPNNQALLSTSGTDAGSKNGRPPPKKAPQPRKQKPKTGSTSSLKPHSRNSSKTGQTPQSVEYLGATPSEPILL